jgi:hypothetical protein
MDHAGIVPFFRLNVDAAGEGDCNKGTHIFGSIHAVVGVG